ncbi:MAG: hypothetical protein IIC26_07190 [Chloroflexi bacterium]|nr:hypothetical protein [Chloroflexota bacterium]
MASMLAYCLLAAAMLSGSSHPMQDLAQLRGQFRVATGARDKIELLTKIAALHVDETSDHAVTQAVVEALGDELRGVGARAADLLGAGLNADLALDGLVEAASRFADEQAQFFERERASGEHLDVAGEDVQTRLKRRGTHFRDAARRMQEHAAYRKALMQALLLRRDDRCATGLGHLLPGQGDIDFEEIGAALASLLEARLDGRTKNREEEIALVGRMRLGRKKKGLAGVRRG